jgi:hypothetical protein
MTDYIARDLQPVAVDALAEYGYATRRAALQLVREQIIHGPPHLHRFALDDMLALDDDDRREVLACLVAMAAASFLEYYWAGRDPESAEHAISRELRIAEDLMSDPPWAADE